MSQDKQLSYDDLVQLALFPDGSPLSSRLQNASLFKDLRKVDPTDHEKAVRFASLVNQEIIRSLDYRLSNWRAVSQPEAAAAQGLRSNSGVKVPTRPLDATNFSSKEAEDNWGREIEKNLKQLLKGVNLLAGYKASVSVAATGIELFEEKLKPRDTYKLRLWVEDAVGFQQDLPVEMGIQADGTEEQLLAVNGEDSFLRLQVWHTHVSKHPALKRKASPTLLGEVRVPVLGLVAGEEMPLELPVFSQSGSTSYRHVPIYDPRSPEDPPQGFTTVVDLQLNLFLQTDKPTAADFAAAKLQAAGQVETGMMERAQTARKLKILRTGVDPQSEATASSDVARQRWVFAIKTIRAHNRLRIRGRELKDAIEKSSVLQEKENAVEERFRNLMDQVFMMWEEKLRQTPNNGENGAAAPQSISCNTMVNKKAQGCLVPDEQPLYFILKMYDEQLNEAMQNMDLVGKYIPDMAFFHPLFVYASMAGVRPLLFKAELVSKLLGRWDTANEALLKFVHVTMDALKEADQPGKQLLTKYERKLFMSSRQHLQPKMKKTLVQHYDKLSPADAAGRTVLLEIVSQFMPSFNTQAALGREVLKLAQARYRANLAKCDADKVDHMLNTLSVANSENVQNTAMALGDIWEQSARDFEADLALEALTKDVVQIRDTVMEQYRQLKFITELLVGKAPSWPYTLYGYDAMSKIESSIMAVNKVLEKYDVATGKTMKEANAKLKLNMTGAPDSSIRTTSARTHDIERYWYKVVVYTSKMKGAGTDSEVYLNITGNAGSSGKLVLNQDKVLAHQKGTDLFEKGEKNEFRLSTTTFLGVLQEVDIGIDGKGEGHSWHLDRLEITDETNNQVWYFECNNWLSRTKGDLKLERKLVANTEPPSQRKVRYFVKVQTSDIRGAGTDAYVHLTLKGSIGTYATFLDTKFKDNFERGHLDTFQLYCTELGNIDSIVVTLSSKLSHYSGDDWHLQDIRVINEKTKVEWLFLCSRWFNKDNLVAELTPLDEADLAEYRVSVYTSDKSGASTDARVYIVLDGDEASSGLLRLKDTNKNTFEKGAKDEFTIRCRDLGKLKLMKLGHDGSSGKKLALNADLWNVAKVEIVDVRRSHEYYLPCNFWVGKSLTSSAKLEHEVLAPPPRDVTVRRKVTYVVVVYTSDITHASTNAKRVFVELIGDKFRSGKQLLETPKGGFQRGSSESLRLECTDVGILQQISLGCSSSSFGDSWHVDRVEVLSEGQHVAVFPCNNWLSTTRGDKKTERLLSRAQATVASTTLSAHAPVVLNHTATDFTLLDWPTLLWGAVTAQVRTIIQQYPPVIDRQLATIRTWTAVSQRLPYALEVKPVIEATIELINACLIQVIIVIAHSSLRAQAATRVLSDAVQPVVQKVATFIKTECLQSLVPVQPRACEAPITVFDDQGRGEGLLEGIAIKVNTMVQYHKVVDETIMSYIDEATTRITPEDTAKVRRAGRLTQQRMAQQTFQVVSALHQARRFGFLVIVHDCLKEVPEEELVAVLPGYLFSKMEQILKHVPKERYKDSINSSWSALLEAVKRVVLGLSVWDLMQPFKLTMEQHSLLEGVLKTLEIQLMQELKDKWEPKESLLLVEEKSHVRLLLELGALSTAELRRTLVEECLEQEKVLAAYDAIINLPYQGTEVVVEMDDLMDLQQNQLGLDVLDYIRLLRCREDGKAAAQAAVEDLYKRGKMQVMFGLPMMAERLLFTAACKRSWTPKLTKSENRSSGHLFVFTSFLCYTTLLTSGAGFGPLQTSDVTNILRRGEGGDTKQPEKYGAVELWITLQDESELKLEFGGQAERDACYKILDSSSRY